MMGFWNSIFFNSNMKGVLKVFFKSLIGSRESFSMFSPLATDFESEIAQRIARLELLFEYHDSQPHL